MSTNKLTYSSYILMIFLGLRTLTIFPNIFYDLSSALLGAILFAFQSMAIYFIYKKHIAGPICSMISSIINGILAVAIYIKIHYYPVLGSIELILLFLLSYYVFIQFRKKDT